MAGGVPRLVSTADTGRWLAHRLAETEPGVTDVEVTAVERVARGVSRETWLIDARVQSGSAAVARGFVVRRDHEIGSVDPIPLRHEYEVYRHLGGTAVPIAEALWFEDDPEWSPDGRAAYVRARVEGHWRLPFVGGDDPDDDDRRIDAAEQHLDALATVHLLDWQALGLDELYPAPRDGADVVPNLVRWFIGRLREYAFEPSPVLAEGVDRLLATAPVAPAVTFCKGTNGHGEEIWHEGRIVAMSDWELACIAEPAYDLAQVQEMIPTIVRDGRRVWGWPEALAHYSRRSGIDVTMERVEYYRRFYALAMFTYTHHAASLVHRRGNRLARFAWSASEMQHQAELRFAAVAGFTPGSGPGRGAA